METVILCPISFSQLSISLAYLKLLVSQSKFSSPEVNSAEHEILNAHKYDNHRKFSTLGSDKPVRLLFFLFINAKMPTIVGILTCMSRKIFMLS